jgi:HSP20 family protein
MNSMLRKWDPFLAGWNPFRELDDFRRKLSTAIGEGEGTQEAGNLSLGTADWSPSVDIEEDDNEFLIKADLPEVKKDDVHVTVEGRTVTISGERKIESETTERKVHRSERCFGSYSRSFRLPESVDTGKMNAGFKDGVLTVHLPKSKENRPKQVEIKIG